MDTEAQGKESPEVALKDPPHQEPYKPDKKKRTRRTKLLCCCGVCLGVTVAVIVVLIIFIFTVFKQRNPTIRVNKVTLQGLKVKLGDIFTDPNLSVDLGLLTSISVKNPNYAGFNYDNTTAYMYYQGLVIGNSAVPAGKVKSRSTEQMSTLTTVVISGSIINDQLTNDVAAGVLPIVTNVQIKGTAKVFGVFSIKHVRTNMTCNVLVFIVNQTQSFHCDYTVHL